MTEQRQKRRAWKGSFPYETDYNDHFETPVVAYQDLTVFLDWLQLQQNQQESTTTTATTPQKKTNPSTSTARSDLVLYDPYYCEGRTAEILHTLGYTNVVHEKRDFYRDIELQQVPAHNVLVTNPPYSDDHKKQCLDYCWKQLNEHHRPFCLLLPAYVAAKLYYRAISDEVEKSYDSANSSHIHSHIHSHSQLIYLVPNQAYQYDHPEGTGKAESPFDSLWFCGIHSPSGSDRSRWQDLLVAAASKSGRFRVVRSLVALKALGIVSAQTRPNPRQRRKRNRQKGVTGQEGEPVGQAANTARAGRPAMGSGPATRQETASASANSTDVGKPSSSSKYRDPSSGKRSRKRF
jgi:hypothetical protein